MLALVASRAGKNLKLRKRACSRQTVLNALKIRVVSLTVVVDFVMKVFVR